MTPEGKIKKKLNQLLDSYGESVYRYMPVPSGFGKQAVDYFLCVDGLFVAVEAKPPGGKPTARQSDTLDDVKRAGGSSFVVNDEVSLSAFKQFLDGILRK